MTRLILACATLLLTACGPAAPDEGATDAGSEGVTDAGADDVPDAGSDDGKLAINCMSFQGVHSPNSKWTYRWDASNRVGVRSARVIALNDLKNQATIETSESWTQTTGGVSVNGTTTETFRCNTDGVFLVSARVVSSQTIAGQTTAGDTTTTYDPPRFLRPNGPVLGDTWSSTWTGVRVSASGSTPVDGSASFEVTEDGINVTGGFRAIRISQAGGPNAYLWQQGFGVIHDVTFWLSSFTP